MIRNGWTKGLRLGWIGALLWLSMMIGAIPAAAESEGTTKVTVHYKPVEGDTIEWSLWVWGDGESGARFPFTGEDEFGKVAEIELPGAYSKVGVIVSTGDWKKDGGDRFVDIVDGTGVLRVTGEGYQEDPAANVPYLWAIVGIAMLPVLLHALEYARSRKAIAALE